MKTAEKVPAYSVWGKDRVAYGPMELSDLARWIQEGLITAESWMFYEPDNRWRRAGDFPELQEFFSLAREKGIQPTPSSSAARSLLSKPEMMRRFKVFASLEEPQIESFVRFMELVKYPQFSHIVRKGEHGDAMYLVVEGEVRALTIVDGKEAILTTIPAGGTFGEISLLDQGPRSADIIANRDSVLLKLSAEAFERLVREAPTLAVPLVLALSLAMVGQVRGLTKRYEELIHFIRSTTMAH